MHMHNVTLLDGGTISIRGNLWMPISMSKIIIQMWHLFDFIYTYPNYSQIIVCFLCKHVCMYRALNIYILYISYIIIYYIV